MGMTSDDIYDIRVGLNFCRDRAEQILARIKELEQIIDEQEIEDINDK